MKSLNYAGFKVLSGPISSDLLAQILALRKMVWPEFIRLPEEEVTGFYSKFPEFQLALVEQNTQELIGIMNSVPIGWKEPLSELPEEGLDYIRDFQCDALERNYTLCTFSITIHPKFRHRGLSRLMIRELKAIAREIGFSTIVLPLRPTSKANHPLVAMEEYVLWKNEVGVTFDPWLRVHYSEGAVFIKVCRRSARVEQGLDQWEKWTGINFTKGGSHIIPNGLVPLEVDLSKGIGVYAKRMDRLFLRAETLDSTT